MKSPKIIHYLRDAALTMLALTAFSLKANIIDVPPPGGDDHAVLQAAIDCNPDAILMLDSGTYDLGNDHLNIPHGITIRGKVSMEGILETTIRSTGEGAIHVNATGAFADDDVNLSELVISSQGISIYHAPVDPQTAEWLPGGGNLVISGCIVESEEDFAILCSHISKPALVMKDSVISSNGNDAIRLNYADYSSLEISNCEIDISGIPPTATVWNPDCIEILNEFGSSAGIPGWFDWQSPGQCKTKITDNVFLCHNLYFWTVGFKGINLYGNAFIYGNTFSNTGVGTGLQLQVTSQASVIRIEDNRFIGAEPVFYGPSLAVEIVEGVDAKSNGGAHVQCYRNKIEGIWSVGFELYNGSHKNTFIDNDFSSAEILGFPAWGYYPVHYEFWGEEVWAIQGLTTGKNSVTDNSGSTLYYYSGEASNHFQGSSTFIAVQ